MATSGALLLALQRATHATLDALATELRELGLPAADVNVLANLADGRPRTVSQLAHEVGTRPTTMTALLDRLENRGWVTRSPHPDDRRALLISLTSQGRPVAATAQAAYRRVERRIVNGLAAGEAARFAGLLRTAAERAHA